MLPRDPLGCRTGRIALLQGCHLARVGQVGVDFTSTLDASHRCTSGLKLSVADLPTLASLRPKLVDFCEAGGHSAGKPAISRMSEQSSEALEPRQIHARCDERCDCDCGNPE